MSMLKADNAMHWKTKTTFPNTKTKELTSGRRKNERAEKGVEEWGSQQGPNKACNLGIAPPF